MGFMFICAVCLLDNVTDVELELIIAVISLISAISSPMITILASSKKRKLQVSFDHSKDYASTTLIIRNTGPQSIFIDEIWLHKTQWIEYNIFDRFSRNTGKPITVDPGMLIKTTFSELELTDILNDAKIKGNVDKSWPRYEEFRLGFKVVICSSEGIGSTRWFKIGKRGAKGYSHQYDFIGYHKSYYDLRRYYNSISWGQSILVPVIVLLCGAIAYYEGSQYDWIPLLAGYISLVVVSIIFVTDGLPNRNAVRKHIWILTISFGVIFWMISGEVLLTAFLTFLMAGYHIGVITKYSGWDL